MSTFRTNLTSGDQVLTSEIPIARKISRSSVIRTVLRYGSISRAELAKQTGFSKQTISEVVGDLEKQGWLRASGMTDGRPGRSAVVYELNASARMAVSIDLGGTKVAAAICDLLGNIVAETKVSTDPQGGIYLVDQFADIISELTHASGISTDSLQIVVLGSPGVTDPVTGYMSVAPNVPGIDAFDLRRALEERIGIPTIIENDVNLAAEGERWRGKSANLQNFVFVALGTGIGMGIVSNGVLLRGARGAAGEISYLPIGADAFDPAGFALGTFESAAGSAAILRRFIGYGGQAAKTVEDVFVMLGEGDTAAQAAIDETARTIAVAVAAIAATLDPEVVITGGSIGARTELIEAIRGFLPRCTPHPPRIEISALGNRAALIGGIAVAVERMHHQLFGVQLDGASRSATF